MIARSHIDEDLQLKQFARTSPGSKPRFDWSPLEDADAGTAATPPAAIPVSTRTGESRILTTNDIAAMIGDALTDLMLARQEQDIFTDKNRRLVSRIANLVSAELSTAARAQAHAGNNHIGTASGSGNISPADITRLIERALVRDNAYDLARSIITRHQAADGRDGENDTYMITNSTSASGSGNSAAHAAGGCRVIRRNGHVVNWNQNKVEIALRKAFLSEKLDADPAVDIARLLSHRLRDEGRQMIHIEELQDLVQEELMKAGHYKVAASYVLYRAHRSEVRKLSEEDSRQEAIDRQEHMILVKNDDGTTFLWDGLELRRRIDFARIGLDLCLNADQIENELRRSLFPEMTLEDLNRTVILNAKVLIERDADFAKFAARIILSYIYEEVLGWSIMTDGMEGLAETHRRAFRAYLQRGVEINRISPRLLDYDLDRLAAALDPSADMDFDFLGIQTLYDRYLIIDKTAKKHRRLETPQFFWMRVAMGLFVGDDSPRRLEHVIALYQLYKGRRFCSSTPTLFNSGTKHSQLSSCYLYKVDDSIESIMIRGIAENAFLSKWAGGLGGSWTAVRGTGSYIQGTNGESQGVIPFLKLHNDQLIAVNQGGKRRGSGCAYLETWHNDIREFIELRRNTGDERRRTHDMNTANWIPDLFMKRLEARQNWTLFRSNECPELHDLYGRAFEDKYHEYEAKAARGEVHAESVRALDLWLDMLRMIFETGHPWITFKDPCNVRSPQDHCGVIHSSNLCTEITLNTSEDETAVCNLGSIILENHLDAHGQIDHDKLRTSIRTAVRALDNVIDINFYPTEAAGRANRRHRPIGLGVMGLANCLYLKNLSFASAEAVDFNDEIMEAVAYYAYEASSDLAAERGAYSSYQGSKWSRNILPQDTIELLEQERGVQIEVPRASKMDWAPLRAKIAKQGMRNSNVLAIAPTATISNIMGSTPCIEPQFKNLYVKSNLSGEFIMLNEYLVRDLKARRLWSQEMLDKLKYYDGELTEIDEIPADLKDKYRTAFAIGHQWIIEAAARRQKWIDQSQSLNLFLASPDLKTLSHMYRAAWRAGLKTTYYLRTFSASNAEKSTITVKKQVRITAEDPINTALPIPAAASAANSSLKLAPEPPDLFDSPAAAPARTFTPEQIACSIEARRNGVECEVCQ